MRDLRMPVWVVAGVSGAVTTVVALFPWPGFASRLPLLHVALGTALPLFAAAAGLLVIGRLRRCARLDELTLGCSLGVLAVSEFAFVTVPLLLQRFWPELSVWAALGGSALGAVLFALAAYAPHRRLRRPGLMLAAGGAAATAALLVIAVLAVTFADRLPRTPFAAALPSAPTGLSLRSDAALAALEITVAAIYGLAAAGFLRRSEQFKNDYFLWLAISAVLASAAHVNYFLHPTLYLHFFSVGDVFLLCFYAVLLAGLARKALSRWHAAPQAAVLEERRRIARDLHDGAAQELAYLVRNLDALNGTVDTETKAHLRRAAERAELDIRLAIDEIAAPSSQSVNAAIAQAVGEVAARDHIKLELDVVPGVQLSAPRADALVGIAREAVSNAARHSGAARVSLSLQRQDGGVRLRVSDNGSGFDTVAQADGFGLASMRDRATLVGGDLWIMSVPGCGTEVEVTL
jgi:signal transduction histidine kinase